MRILARSLIALSVVALPGCDLVAMAGDRASAPASNDSANTSPPEQGADTGASPLSNADPPVYWSLAGQLTLAEGGALDLAASDVRVQYYTEAVEPRCGITLNLLSEALPPDSEEPAILAWYAVDVGPSFSLDPDCEPWPDSVLDIGIGTYDPSLDAAADAREWSDLQLYGLYVRAHYDPGPRDPFVWLTGVTGTEAMFAGKETARVEAPLAAGVYPLQTLILLDLP